eukprot:GHVU01005777.1.p2 GENE.GHVU01005777.1~~GHVU01005777.1.p2  ORF type:complete len:118 (+),score=13.28 GHVU01005777.1:151-504(+)
MGRREREREREREGERERGRAGDGESDARILSWNERPRGVCVSVVGAVPTPTGRSELKKMRGGSACPPTSFETDQPTQPTNQPGLVDCDGSSDGGCMNEESERVEMPVRAGRSSLLS